MAMAEPVPQPEGDREALIARIRVLASCLRPPDLRSTTEGLRWLLREMLRQEADCAAAGFVLAEA